MDEQDIMEALNNITLQLERLNDRLDEFYELAVEQGEEDGLQPRRD